MRLKLKLLLPVTLAFTLNSFIVFTQDSPENRGNQELYRLSFYGTEKEDNFITHKGIEYFIAIESISVFPFIETTQMATSMLAAEGTPPPRPSIMPEHEGYAPYDFNGDKNELDKYYAYLNWLYMYSPFKATDSDPKTAWVEGRDGQGTGEILLIYMGDISVPLEIWAGFGLTEELFYQNNRPKEVNVYVIEALSVVASQFGGNFKDLVVLGKRKVLLEDRNGFQPLLLPEFQTINSELTLFIAIEILSVYPGSLYDDTCISEIRVQE
jgi:hypothetical protein